MDFYIKSAETGESFKIESAPSGEKVLYLMKQIQNKFKLDIDDQLLLTKEGVKIIPEDLLDNFQKSPNLTHTYHENQLKQYVVIFVINEKIFNSNGEYKFKKKLPETLLQEFQSIPEESL